MYTYSIYNSTTEMVLFFDNLQLLFFQYFFVARLVASPTMNNRKRNENKKFYVINSIVSIRI